MSRSESVWMSGWRFSLNSDDEKDFAPVRLPHDWAIDLPFDRDAPHGESQGFRPKSGIGYYKNTRMLTEKPPHRRYFLDFDGIYENSRVWVNGREAGGQGYGYTPFRLEISDLVTQGENEVYIKVDCSALPPDRWYSGCGIYRSVRWIETAERFIDEKRLILSTRLEGGKAHVCIDTGLAAHVRASLKEAGISADSNEGRPCLIVDNPLLWSAEHPHLYTLELELYEGEELIDALSFKTGIRSAELSAEKGLVVNGEPVKLKGVCLHQDVACVGSAVQSELWRERLSVLKSLGCNAIRAAHHLFAREFLDLCDEMGFYLYEECFDKWTAGLYARYFESGWQQDLDAMVLRDRNRACVLFWGVGNEVENQAHPSMLAILEQMVDRVKSLDPSRPVSLAMNPHFKREPMRNLSEVEDVQKLVDEADETEIEDPAERVERIALIGERVDFLACNYQEQWYEAIHKRLPHLPILGTETYQLFLGHEMQMQNFTLRSPQLVPFEHPYVIGSMVWTGFDYLGESMGWPSKGWCGALVRTNLIMRPTAWLMKSIWSAESVVRLSVIDYSLGDEGAKEHWDIPPLEEHWQFEGICRAVVPYMIFTNCDEVRLFLNGRRFYPASPKDHMISGFIPFQPGELKAEGWTGGRLVCEHRLTTAEAASSLVFERFPEAPISAQAGRELLLTVRACDDGGRSQIRARGRVRFSVAGEASIAGVDNGNLMGLEPYRSDSVSLHRACASVLITLSGRPGRVIVRAHAEGVKPCEAGFAVI